MLNSTSPEASPPLPARPSMIDGHSAARACIADAVAARFRHRADRCPALPSRISSPAPASIVSLPLPPPSCVGKGRSDKMRNARSGYHPVASPPVPAAPVRSIATPAGRHRHSSPCCCPMPPSIVSAPSPPVTMSSPLPPSSVSLPAPPESVSSPAPPSRQIRRRAAGDRIGLWPSRSRLRYRSGYRLRHHRRWPARHQGCTVTPATESA